MKLSKIFHFLYFSVLSIPLVTIPIFAIYSQNHEINDNSITINESWLEVKEAHTTNEVNSSNDLIVDNAYLYTRDLTNVNNAYFCTCKAIYNYKGDYDINIEYQTDRVLRLYKVNKDIYVYDNIYGTLVGSLRCDNYQFSADLIFNSLEYTDDYTYYSQCNNEIIIDYEYHYNEPVVYNDTDIMSQFLYQEYNFMDKYLGIYKFQPFNGIYTWIGNTFFNGTSPIVFTIFYQWLAYWLFVSICWLIFDVLLYVPLLAHRWLDKAGLE